MVGKTKQKPRRAERRSQSGSRRLKRKREQREFRGTARHSPAARALDGLSRSHRRRRRPPPAATRHHGCGQDRREGVWRGQDRTAGTGGGRAWDGKDRALLLYYWTRPLLRSPAASFAPVSVRPSVVSSLVVLVSKAGVLSPSLLAGALMLGRAWADPRRSLPIGRVASLSRGRTRVGRRAGPWIPVLRLFSLSEHVLSSSDKKNNERRRGRTSGNMSFANEPFRGNFYSFGNQSLGYEGMAGHRFR